MKMNLAENLKALREKSGMTQEQLAERMEVSRQTVSKWESGVSFPEMEKMIQLAELFGCSMDALLKGSIQYTNQDEAKAYDRHGDWVARMGTAATGICILSFAAQGIGEAVNPPFLGESGILFLLFALVGALLWIRIGMDSSYFRKKHPYVEPFYTEEEKEGFHRKYVSCMIAGVGILIAALTVMAALSTVWHENGRKEGLSIMLFFMIVAVGVMPIVYAGLQAMKYNVEGYNSDNSWENSEEGKKNSRIMGKACGIIMLAAAAACVVLFALTHSGRISGLPLVIGGIACGAASIYLNKRK